MKRLGISVLTLMLASCLLGAAPASAATSSSSSPQRDIIWCC